MSEPIFLRHSRGLTLDEIATLCGAVLEAPPHARRIVNIAPLDRAAPSDLTFLDHQRYAGAAAATFAGACLTTAALAKNLPPRVAALVVAGPYDAFVKVVRALFPHSLRPSSLGKPDNFAGATIDPTARLESGVTVDPGAVIGYGVEIGAGTLIGANAVIGAEVRIGRDCAVGANTVVACALIGDRVIIHPGCNIGQDGFGFVMGGRGHLKVPQVGRVIIQDDVEIGAGTTIDRGALRDTVIGEGTKIDNMVQVGHNVSIGRHCVLVSQVGIAGSSTLEDFVVLGARAGVKDHVTIGEGSQIAATSNVNGNVPPGSRWGGTPAKPMRQWFREMNLVARLARERDAGSTVDE
ncbi:MAG TPA: UDP-3-O-(3-hydroxymyristoyl)glucosamine N-acyltransferase [Pseudolabrys sp.]|nr:UDP-3-O-(3-hydroxymyristoyl)glucosamine N-acyltransferase [Pseudolabrys sp.]